MTRLIDADALSKELDNIYERYGIGSCGDGILICMAAVAKAPTVEARPHGEWIPIDERLPEDDKEVLVYVRRKDGEKSEMNGLHIARKHQMEGDPEGNNNFWGIPVAPCEWRIEGWSYFFEPEVLAWMPLPEPYKKEGDRDA